MSKTALITGATSGFGDATAAKFVEAGYNVIITGRRTQRLDAFKARFPKANILALNFDVSDKKAVFDAIGTLPEAYKNIDTVIGALKDHGLIEVVATLRPLLTYKG